MISSFHDFVQIVKQAFCSLEYEENKTSVHLTQCKESHLCNVLKIRGRIADSRVVSRDTDLKLITGTDNVIYTH